MFTEQQVATAKQHYDRAHLWIRTAKKLERKAVRILRRVGGFDEAAHLAYKSHSAWVHAKAACIRGDKALGQ